MFRKIIGYINTLHDITQMLQQLPLGFNIEQMTMLCLLGNGKMNDIPMLVRAQQFFTSIFHYNSR